MRKQKGREENERISFITEEKLIRYIKKQPQAGLSSVTLYT